MRIKVSCPCGRTFEAENSYAKYAERAVADWQKEHQDHKATKEIPSFEEFSKRYLEWSNIIENNVPRKGTNRIITGSGVSENDLYWEMVKPEKEARPSIHDLFLSKNDPVVTMPVSIYKVQSEKLANYMIESEERKLKEMQERTLFGKLLNQMGVEELEEVVKKLRRIQEVKDKFKQEADDESADSSEASD